MNINNIMQFHDITAIYLFLLLSLKNLKEIITPSARFFKEINLNCYLH